MNSDDLPDANRLADLDPTATMMGSSVVGGTSPDSGASNSLRPPYGRSQAQAPAQGGGGTPARAPEQEGVAAEDSRDEDQPTTPELSAATHVAAATPPVVRAYDAAVRRRKPKRRRRDSVQKKTAPVTTRLNVSEKQALEAEAQATGVTMAHLVARRILAGGTTESRAGLSLLDELDAAIDELVATRSELSAWGNNLNQISRHLNMGGTLPPGPANDFLTAARHLLDHRLPTSARRLDAIAHKTAKLRSRA